VDRTRKSARWPRRTIDRAISLWGRIQITRAERDVELRTPPKRCPECQELVHVMVVLGNACRSCWSRELIGNWRVLPALKMAVARLGEAQRRGRSGKSGRVERRRKTQS
jgi:hypothetical protein